MIMKQTALYLEDSYEQEFDAKVSSVKDGKFVVLDRTLFYPSSGGQPHDTGKLVRKSDKKEFPVVFTGKFGGVISSETDQTGLQEGDEVHGVIDWDRRYLLMRMHTASHILSGVFHNEAGAKITGNQLDTEKSRVDFSLENFDRELISSFFDKANQIVKSDVEVKSYTMPREEALALPGMMKLANVLPPAVKDLRIVEISGFDRQPDGGTHVRRTGEIGTISFLRAENKGRNNRRVYFELV